MNLKKWTHTIYSRLKDKFKGGISEHFRYNVEISKDGHLNINLQALENASRIRIDIGLSHNAPNSLAWLKRDAEIRVIGIEANRYNIKCLLQRLSDENIHDSSIEARFGLLYCAIDDTPIPKYTEFYHITGDPGTSSLLTPTAELLEKNSYRIREKSAVPVLALSEILEMLNWEKIKYIEVCKVDTQGKDLDVIRSAKNYLSRIAIVIAEVNTWGQYIGAATEFDITHFMISNGFSIHNYVYAKNGKASDIVFVNRKYQPQVKSVLHEFN